MRLLSALAATLVVVSLFAATAPAPAAGQDRVTITITVVTPEGEPVPNANLTVGWTVGSTNETTRSNGQALVDVPPGADLTVRVDHPFSHGIGRTRKTPTKRRSRSRYTARDRRISPS